MQCLFQPLRRESRRLPHCYDPDIQASPRSPPSSIQIAAPGTPPLRDSSLTVSTPNVYRRPDPKPPLHSVAAERKGGGTLLLCDADRLAAEAQAALAAVLLAAGCPWRVIATAAAPLVNLSPRGLFREDLAAMLSTITIELPPLGSAARRSAVARPGLLEEENARSSRQLGGFSSEAIDRIMPTTGRAMSPNWRRWWRRAMPDRRAG